MSRKSTIDDSELRKIMAKKLWEALEYNEMSQADLSDMTDVSRNTISNILYGRHTPSISAVVAIAKALDMSLDDFCGMIADR